MTQPNEARPVISGDIEALARAYGPGLRRFFERRILEHADVDDLVQEVFMRLSKRGELNDVANVEGYLFQTAANILRDRFRQRLSRHARSHEPLSDAIIEDAAFSPERVLLGREAVDQFVSALEELPERTRTIFMLCRFESLTHAEVARRLGISQSSVEKYMVKAMKLLMQRMQENL